MMNEDFDYEVAEVAREAVRKAVGRFMERPLSPEDYWMTVDVTKRGRMQIGFWRDNVDYYKPALKFDLGEVLVEQLGYDSEEDDWTFDPYRKALRRLLRLVDATEKRCTEEYEREHAGEKP
jgi:hypothetical protein